MGANLVVILVREAAHAFATKRYGRRVRRGGLLVYLGGPAFFVDTMDILMEPKRSRIAVSWSGPYSGLLVGSVCMLAIAGTGFSDAGVNEVLFKGAIWAFVYGAIINLNPLLEFDGYYILIDWLEIPMLRKRSMEFVRRNLFNKLINREPFSREERIFGVFGVMALIYTVAVIGLVLFMWQSRASGVLEYAGGWIFWMLAGLIALVLGIPVVLGTWFLGSRAARRTGSWLNRRFLMGRPANQVATLAIAATALAVPALLIETSAGEIYTAVVGGIVVAAGLLLCVRVASAYIGSGLQWFFLTVLLLMGTLLAAQALRPFEGAPSAIANVIAHGVVPVGLGIVIGLLAPTIASFTRTILQGGWGMIVSGAALLIAG